MVARDTHVGHQPDKIVDATSQLDVAAVGFLTGWNKFAANAIGGKDATVKISHEEQQKSLDRAMKNDIYKADQKPMLALATASHYDGPSEKARQAADALIFGEPKKKTA